MQTHTEELGGKRTRYAIRAPEQSDEGFVAQNWQGCVRGAMEARPPDTFARWAMGLIGHILQREEVTVRIAAPPDDPVTIYGFSVLEPGCVHMVFVRKGWRRMGIGTQLLAETGLSIPELAKDRREYETFEQACARKIPMAKYYSRKWSEEAMADGSKRKVAQMWFKDAIDLGPQGGGVRGYLKAGTESAGFNGPPSVELELDTQLGGVVVVTKNRKVAPFLVPSSNIRHMELA